MKCKLRTRTRVLAMCAALVAAAVGLGIPAAQAADPKPRIVFLTPVTNDFFIPVAAGLKAAAAQFGWDSQFLGPPTYDAGKEADLMLTAIRSKPDAIAVAFADPEAFKKPVAEAQAAGNNRSRLQHGRALHGPVGVRGAGP